MPAAPWTGTWTLFGERERTTSRETGAKTIYPRLKVLGKDGQNRHLLDLDRTNQSKRIRPRAGSLMP